MTDVKNCTTCVHRGFFGYCRRVGFQCATELQFGGHCSKGVELRLWQRRTTLTERIKSFISKAEGGAA